MTTIRKRLPATALALLAAAVTLTLAFTAMTGPASASEIKYIVNNVPITSYDIQRRAAFLRLQQRSPASAAEEMIAQTLRRAEMRRLRINIPDSAVDDAYARFAGSNQLSTAQMDQILAQNGVTAAHFREFIRTQIGWSQALGARMRSDAGGMSEQDVVRRMLQDGGQKPSAMEYMLQQVIFVVPAAERSATLAQRRREAEALRNRFNSCDTTREFVRGLIDVTVRDLGRVLEPELPPEWESLIKSARAGSATTVRETDRGLEFIGVCSSREVSNDRVAQMVFRSESVGEDQAQGLSETYTAELREAAVIIER